MGGLISNLKRSSSDTIALETLARLREEFFGGLMEEWHAERFSETALLVKVEYALREDLTYHDTEMQRYLERLECIADARATVYANNLLEKYEDLRLSNPEFYTELDEISIDLHYSEVADLVGKVKAEFLKRDRPKRITRL